MVRASALEPYHFEEMAQMSSIAFRFREKSQPHAYAKALSMVMLEPYPPQELLSRGALNREWDEPAVRELLELMKPELGRVFLMAKEHDETIIGMEHSWEKERWYGTEYSVQRLDEELVAKVSSIINETSEIPLIESCEGKQTECQRRAFPSKPKSIHSGKPFCQQDNRHGKPAHCRQM